MKNIKIFILLVFCVHFFCGKQENKYPQTYDYSYKLTFPGQIYKTIKEDIDKDKQFEFIYLTVDKDHDDTLNNFFNFDRIEIFAWDNGENTYKNILNDTIYFGSKMEFFDVNNDNIKEILLTTNSGGSDSVNSIGLKIYQPVNDHKINKIYDSEIGNPSLIDLDNDKVYEIISYRKVYNKLSGLEGFNYISGIEKLVDGKYINSVLNYSAYIKSMIKNDSIQYFNHRLPKSIIKYKDQEVILNSFFKIVFGKNLIKSKESGLDFWNGERKYLISNLDSKVYLDILNNLQDEDIDVKTEIDSVVSILFKSALDLHKLKKYDEAVNIYLNILDIEPEHYEAYIHLGEIFYNKKDYNEAINYYLQTLFFPRDDKRAFLGLGKCYEKLKDYKQAKLYLSKYLQYDSTSPEALTIKNMLKMKEMN